MNKKYYVEDIYANKDIARAEIIKSLLEDQHISEEVANYFDETNQVQIEALAFLMSECYNQGWKDGYHEG